MTKVAVFIDVQNAYHGARRAFGMEHDHFTAGQIDPLRFGQLVTDLGHAVDPTRVLTSVRPYRGEPSSKHSPKGQAACQRQVAAWSASPLVKPVVRPLKYYADGTVREKGIDVLIALDLAEGAFRNEFDVAVLMSADTDLIPALERVIAHGKRVEVAAWTSDASNSRLRLSGRSMWCHWLDVRLFDQVRDLVNYSASRVVDSV